MSNTEAEVLDEVLARRHSCRAFTDAPVPRATIEAIVAAASRAPSWCNTQPWQLLVLSGEAKDALSRVLLQRALADEPFEYDIEPPRYVGASLARRREAGWQLYGAVGAKRGDRAATRRQSLENFRFFGAPHVAIVTSDRALGPYGLVDCGAFISLFLAVAAAHGVATIAQAAVVCYAPAVREHLRIPDDRLLVCGISFGYEDVDHPANSFRTSRVPGDELITYRS